MEEFEVEDENTGEEQQTLQFRILNLKLLPDYQDVAGYEVLPIGRFEKSTTQKGARNSTSATFRRYWRAMPGNRWRSIFSRPPFII